MHVIATAVGRNQAGQWLRHHAAVWAFSLSPLVPRIVGWSAVWSEHCACPGCHATLHVTAACSCLHYCWGTAAAGVHGTRLLSAAAERPTAANRPMHCSPVFTRCSALCVTLRRTATSSMTSVPKPLKFLRPHYDTLKARLEGLAAGEPNRQQLADVVSGGWWGCRAQELVACRG